MLPGHTLSQLPVVSGIPKAAVKQTSRQLVQQLLQQPSLSQLQCVRSPLQQQQARACPLHQEQQVQARLLDLRQLQQVAVIAHPGRLFYLRSLQGPERLFWRCASCANYR